MSRDFQILLKYPSVTLSGGLAPKTEHKIADYQYSISGVTSFALIFAHFTPWITGALTKLSEVPPSGFTRDAYEPTVPRLGVAAIVGEGLTLFHCLNEPK